MSAEVVDDLMSVQLGAIVRMVAIFRFVERNGLLGSAAVVGSAAVEMPCAGGWQLETLDYYRHVFAAGRHDVLQYRFDSAGARHQSSDVLFGGWLATIVEAYPTSLVSQHHHELIAKTWLVASVAGK